MAENLHKTVGEIVTGQPLPMSGYEYYLWLQYRQRYGFSSDRLEWVTANGASAICHAWGARTKAEDIVPHFYGRRGTKKKIIHQLASLPGALVEFTPNDPTRKILTGHEALEELDRASGRAVEQSGGYREGKSRTLDGPRKPEVPRSRTLSGD